MAPLIAQVDRREFPCGFRQYYKDGACHPQSDWYLWGRWVFAAVFLAVAVVLVGFISSHHRRKRGLKPFYGTGWMSRSRRQGDDDPSCCRDGRQGRGDDEWKGGAGDEKGNLQKPEKTFFPR
ncbi:hypothetical protein QBC34DRAFT_182059 [Podospora aff. communis PSN243]|uniref:Uncharacterized protein n=1 Tax=Podospora aff. communis PSN243 TaxID=3040156 RepID=A0AAV9G9B8_9PEZI|nr:hypothetical protein QBC34DRAFT_182059 [Podospora aff. communis PSN243]